MKFNHIYLFLLVFLTSCVSVVPKDYAAEKPELDLKQYFNGTIDAWGMFQDRSGKVVKRFTVVIDAKWKDNVGTLDEDFTYSDGTKERRVWTITKTGAHDYTGTAGDVVGTAVGEAHGNALNWRYVLNLKVGESNYNVNFNDWMYLMDDKVMLNRAEMSKFGFKLGEVTLSFKKR
jgi:Protein of unknown function (DUF3833)